MHENQPIWISWSRAFHQWGISEGVASLLEGSGSLSLLAAEIVYLSQPLLSGVVSARSLQAFVRILENPAEKREFVTLLREAPFSGTNS